MSFGSPSKLFSPGSSKPNQTFPPMQQQQMQQQQQLKPGFVSMAMMINYVNQKVYTEFSRLVDLLPSSDDVDKKKSIAKFLSRSRNFYIRLQALNKWNPSAQKVDKCEKISNLLDNQSSYLHATAEELYKLAKDNLPQSRLCNLMPILAADVFATKTYSRLPNIIRRSVIGNQPVSKIDKTRMFSELDRILRIRLSNSKIPYRMKTMDISNGRVTFTVPNEFTVTLTLLSDHFDHSWKLLNILFLVKGNNICRGRSLVHINHLKSLHEFIQVKINSCTADNKPSLYMLYDMLHSLSMSLQLDVLHEQTKEYIAHRNGILLFELKYREGSNLSFSYWSKYAQGSAKHMMAITIDDEDCRRPLKVIHNPPLVPDCRYTDRILDSSNLSIKDLIADAIQMRMYSTLKILQRVLTPFVHEKSRITISNMMLIVPLLTSEMGDHNLKVQVNSSNGIIRTSFQIDLDYLTKFQDDRINLILNDLDNDINELLIRSYSHNVFTNAVVNQNASNSTIIISHRRNISNSMNKLRIILAKYQCFLILHKAGFKNLHLLLYKPPIYTEKCTEAFNRNPLYQLLNRESKSECELIYIPVNNEWNYYMLIVCETRFRTTPHYQIYRLITSKVFSVSNNTQYSEKAWCLRPVKLTPIDMDSVKQIINSAPSDATNTVILNTPSQIIGNKRKASDTPPSEQLNGPAMKKAKTDSGVEFINIVKTDDIQSHQIITYLPAILGSERDSIILRLLFNECEKQSLRPEWKCSDDMFLLSFKIPRFPLPNNCSERASKLMNKLLVYCSITYLSQSQEFDSESNVKWEAQFFFKSPFILFNSTLPTQSLFSKKVVLCTKKCSEENRIGLKETVDRLLSYWEELCIFCDKCLLSIFDYQGLLESDFQLLSYSYDEISLGYGNKSFKITVKLVNKKYDSCLEVNNDNGKNCLPINPHILIKKDIDNYLNSTQNINVVLNVLKDTIDFFSYLFTFSNPALLVMQDSSSVQVLRNYALIVREAYHVVLVFRERFAINVILNCDTHTVELSDAHKNFHACNMSIKEMPAFDKFMCSLEEAYRVNIEDEEWSGLLIDQLGILLGISSPSYTRQSISLLENYLLSALQLGGREELCISLIGGKEGTQIQNSVLKIELVPKEDKTTPFWELVMNIKFDEGSNTERPWLSDSDMLANARKVFENKIKAPKLSESGLTMFKKILQLPSCSLQRNILKILSQPPRTLEDQFKKNVVSVDLDWLNIHDAISQAQDPTSILLRFLLTVRVYSVTTNVLENSLYLPIVLHYAARSNQITVRNGTHVSIQKMNLDKESNDMLVGMVNGETPLLVFFNRLVTNIKECIN